ncbi:type II secretion system F family protein [Novosphingobium sp. MMS21-SN21R]|uniref:type II secretion system F family protein n=1 Tax=Novosphingobium sp. MMS21-SN21R TaxID=2969298 RepID=UPI00288743CC|nr:type II secretion system F family protein [Novosphingobium sp. MMS21-SN21R]MDT0508410.1 type II secretion system F family protein [Novosphingobium sp. MMS21-SN21R]
MPSFAYRAIERGGAARTGTIDAPDLTQATMGVRRLGLLPVSIAASASGPGRTTTARRGASAAKSRAAATTIISELSVLLGAGLQLERALALAIENIESPAIAAQLTDILRLVREGMPLSRAFETRPELFGPGEVAMTEAGEANGRLAESLARLAEMLEAQAELRRTVRSAMFYPTMLTVVSVGVTLLMLLFVVPQFESVFAASKAPLPLSSQIVMGASRGLRDHGLLLLLVLVGAIAAARVSLARPEAREVTDRLVLTVPQLGELVRRIETARFARTLGALVEGNVGLPAAFSLAQRTIGNRTIAVAIGKVASGIREGGGVTAPLAAAGVLPRLAIGFFRTGEESARLGPMLLSLADVLDRDVMRRTQGAIALATPIVTALLGMVVAGIIASIMSAILGFNDLAIST